MVFFTYVVSILYSDSARLVYLHPKRIIVSKYNLNNIPENFKSCVNNSFALIKSADRGPELKSEILSGKNTEDYSYN